jgi:hypothetical protein
MTTPHRATPEQDDLRARIEALEAAQLEQAESGRFCVDAIVRRVEALELAHRIQSGTLTSAERAELGVVTRVQLEAAMLRSASDARQTAMTELRAASAEAQPTWRPLGIETTYGSEAAADAAQILRAPMVVEGTFEHGGETYRFKAKPEREAPMTELRAASAEARPTVKQSLTDGGSLLEMVAKAIYNVPHDSAAEARAAICAVATWLDRFALHGSGEYAQAAKVLRQEVGRG